MSDSTKPKCWFCESPMGTRINIHGHLYYCPDYVCGFTTPSFATSEEALAFAKLGMPPKVYVFLLSLNEVASTDDGLPSGLIDELQHLLHKDKAVWNTGDGGDGNECRLHLIDDTLCAPGPGCPRCKGNKW